VLPWKPNHRCRGKGKVHIVEVHYDSKDEEMQVNATIDAYLKQSNEASGSCASEGQLDGQDLGCGGAPPPSRPRSRSALPKGALRNRAPWAGSFMLLERSLH
jgi:hypothetical protein